MGMIVAGTALIVIIWLVLANSQSLISFSNSLTQQYIHAINILQGKGA